jgi:hypothetical protein
MTKDAHDRRAIPYCSYAKPRRDLMLLIEKDIRFLACSFWRRRRGRCSKQGRHVRRTKDRTRNTGVAASLAVPTRIRSEHVVWGKRRSQPIHWCELNASAGASRA